MVKHYTKEQIKKVANQITNMLYNDIELEQGTERFVDWCADGEVCEDENGVVDEGAWELAQRVGNKVDELVCKLDFWAIFK